MTNKHTEIAKAAAQARAALGTGSAQNEQARVTGRFSAVCHDKDGNELWSEQFDNLVTDQGARLLLDNGLAGSAYTAAFFLGLISSVSYTAVAVGDTMASHAGWLEAGLANAPAYSETARRTAAWSAASGRTKAFSAGVVYTFTSAGTIKGSFLATNATKDGTTGTLYSAGLFSAPGDQPVVATNTLTVTYTASL
jgi:hypothetical protein